MPQDKTKITKKKPTPKIELPPPEKVKPVRIGKIPTRIK